MTLTAFDIYLLGLVDTLRAMLFVIACLATAFSGLQFNIWSVYSPSALANSRAEAERCYRLAKRALAVAAVTGVLGVATPSQQTLAGMYVLPAVVNSGFVQELPADIVALARAYVKDLTDSLVKDEK